MLPESLSSGRPGKFSIARWRKRGSIAAQVYVTNTVKHFKWEPRGKRRIHQKPNSREIAACRPWLEAELRVVRPGLLVCLGRDRGAGDLRAVLSGHARTRQSAEVGARAESGRDGSSLVASPPARRRIARTRIQAFRGRPAGGVEGCVAVGPPPAPKLRACPLHLDWTLLAQRSGSRWQRSGRDQGGSGAERDT